jgi:hypothetical protein
MSSAEPDTIEAALAGTLGQSTLQVQALFRAVDLLVARLCPGVQPRAIRSKGLWIKRSYVVSGRVILRLDPRAGHLCVQVGYEAFARAPPQLQGRARQSDWIQIRPEHASLGLSYLQEVLQRLMQRASFRGGLSDSAELALMQPRA